MLVSQLILVLATVAATAAPRPAPTLETLATTSDVIWGFDFLSSETMIFTERGGKLKTLNLKTKAITEIKGTPAVHAQRQGGLLDVRVHPTEKNKIYLTYSKPMGKSLSTTALAIADVNDGKLSNVKDLFVAKNPCENEIHYGSRIEFDGQGHLFLSVGDRNERDEVQKLSNHIGKMIRLKLDGSVPADNPFVKTPNALPEIWSLGHRSPQGLVRHPQTGDLWLGEMGPRGGDELNLILPGKNYGWPEVTYGREYWGPKIGDKEKPGTEQPKAHWVPSISPSGMTFFNQDLYVGCLSGQHVRRIRIQKQSPDAEQESLFANLNERFRNLRLGPDQWIYASTDSGKIMRFQPKAQ